MTLGPLMIDIEGTELTAADRELLGHPLIGAALLFARNFASIEQLADLVRDIHSIRTPQLLVTVDQEGGRVQRFRAGFTPLPPLRHFGRVYDMDATAARLLARQYGWLMAAELRAVGVDMSFAPVVDLDYGVSTVIGDRALHRDSHVVAELAVAIMGGMREAGMIATAKHFPGHGAVVLDSHVTVPVDRRPRVDLDDDLYPYRRLIDNGLGSIVVSHVVFADVDARPASMSRRWIQDELRGRLGFGGAVITDDLSMGAAASVGELPMRARLAWAAGCDVLTVCNDRAAVYAVLEAFQGMPGRPLSQIRMARLHGGRRAPSLSALQLTAQWQECAAAIRNSMERPDLHLNT